MICVQGVNSIAEENDAMVLNNGDLQVKIGEYGEINSLKIVSDENEAFRNTEYVLNSENASKQGESEEHCWMGEVMLSTLRGEEEKSINTSESTSRKIERKGEKIEVSYEEDGCKITENYYMVSSSLRWEIEVKNTGEGNLTVEDLGLPMAFNQYWTPSYDGEELYDTRCVYHSFVGKDSSYIYATRPSGQGKILLFTPVSETGAGFEYRDHWRENNGHQNSSWAQDKDGYHSGLDVFYIHSDKIKSTGSAYMDSTALVLPQGESKKYAFEFTACNNEKDLKRKLYEKGIVDAVAVPSMVTTLDMTTSFYLHANDDIEIDDVYVNCIHETKLYEGRENFSVSYDKHNAQAQVTFKEKKIYDGENYYIYNLDLKCLGANCVFVKYRAGGEEKETMLQFYAMENLADAIDRRSAFLTEHQTDTPGEVGDKTFDDWMMDSKKNRAETMSGYWDMSYWGWGDDWGLTHGTFLALKNVYKPVKEEVEALDEYLDVAIWNTLMREHQEDYLIHDFLSSEPNLSPTYRGYAYPHIYNTYFAMYEICNLYPDLIEYKEKRSVYLLRAYNILKALYSDNVAYNWSTGLMGEITTPDIIKALEKEGFYDEADDVRKIMSTKYDNFKNTKYPYGSEYSYDNTGEEAVYTLAKMNGNEEMMYKIDLKTRACRGLQPVWYYYANPVTICGENRWNFQYTASLAGYCMDDYLRNVDSSMTKEERAVAERVNYGGKIANFTCINSGQIDADEENIGTVSWTYQAELGNSGGQGTGGGKLHNGWLQMAGEADLGLFGAMSIMSSDVATDPVFGLVGYGCDVKDEGKNYKIVPHDGVFAKLNMIDEKLYVSMKGVTYSEAVVKKDKSEIRLKTTGNADYAEIEISGLEKGVKYALYENGKIKATAFGENAVFTYQGEKSSTVVIRRDPHAIEIEPYKKPTEEKEAEKRALLSENAVIYDFENSSKDKGENGADGKSVGNVVIEEGRVISDGTVKSYVRLPSSLANETRDFTLKIDIAIASAQKSGTRIVEFSDTDGKNLSLYFGENNSLVLDVCNEKTNSEISLPEKYEGEIVLRQKGKNITLWCGGEKALSTKTDFTLSELGDTERNYIGRGSDETTGALKGSYDNFYFIRKAEDVEEKATDAYPISAERIVTDEKHTLPKKVNVLYSDGFYRMTDVSWGEENGTTVKGKAGLLDIEAKVRRVSFGKNLALDAIAKASYCSSWESVEAVNDGKYTLETSNPDSSEIKRLGTWTRDSSEEWVSLTWDEEVELSGVGIVFVDDFGGLRAPISYRIEYLNDDGAWCEVDLPLGGETKLLTMNETSFERVKTSSLRIVMQKGEYAGVGVMEIEAYASEVE
jgi:hypothetical protein